MSSPDHDIPGCLRGLHPLFDELCNISGAPGLAIGVIHEDKIIYENYLGYRDVKNQLVVDRDTVFNIASLTKAMTAAAVGILVDQGALEWSTPVQDILPDLRDANLSVVDLLNHRSGATWADALYLQSNNRIMLPKEESIRTFNSLPIIAPPRSKYLYNNHAFNIVGLVIERLSGKNWGDFMKEKLFQPLNMTRTSTRLPAEDSNVALPYNILLDKTAFQLPQPELSNNSMMFAGASVETSVADLLKLYQSYLHAIQSRFDNKDTPPSPIKQVAELIRPQIARPVNSLLEQTYALGWSRTQLPGKIHSAWNSKFVAELPLLGRNASSRLALWHGGSMPGAEAAVCLLPQSGTAVVVLQNSLGLCIAADWACQAIVNTIFLGEPGHDYLKLARECVWNGGQRIEEVQKQLDNEQILGTMPRPLTDYVGKYRNDIGNWIIEIYIDDAGKLCLKFQAREDELYVLRHYQDNVFVWNLSYDEMVKRSQFLRPYAYYKIEFESSTRLYSLLGRPINRLRWRHDPNVPEGEIFIKVA